MEQKPLLTIILAAGKGTRMKSELPKVLHSVAGQPMVSHVINVAKQAGSQKQALVIGHKAEMIRSEMSSEESLDIYIQEEQLGTAHAVLSAREAISNHNGNILILYGDTPLLSADTMFELGNCLDGGKDLAVLGFKAKNPQGYGRLLVNDAGELLAIREQKDATPEELKVDLCNSGVMIFKSNVMLELLDSIDNDNANSEYYLTDAIEIANKSGMSVGTVICDESEVLGVNNRVQLSEAEHVLQTRLRQNAMESGVTMIAPETVTLSYDTKFGTDVIIEPNVVFAPGVEVESNVQVRAFSYLEKCMVRQGAVVGPYARIRPDSDIGQDAKIGNFVEVKKATIENGAKVNHLSYIGDAHVGANANIGAGTITCNYDGFLKHKTEIGEESFVGSNSSLVAPVKIGRGAYVGSGSVITKNISPDALAITRAKQEEHEGWALKYKMLKLREKARKSK